MSFQGNSFQDNAFQVAAGATSTAKLADITESASATETESAVVTFVSSITESGTALDVESVLAIFVATDTESGSATEVESVTAVFISSLTESAIATETESTTAIFAPSIIEIATALDSSNAILIPGTIIVTEVCTAGDTCDAGVARSGHGPGPLIRDPWDRDTWGRLIPGAGYRR